MLGRNVLGGSTGSSQARSRPRWKALRSAWSDGLGLVTLAEKPDAEVLYWVGCAASYDDRAKKIARAVARLLKEANVDFAILGQEETCTGDPARRAP